MNLFSIGSPFQPPNMPSRSPGFGMSLPGLMLTLLGLLLRMLGGGGTSLGGGSLPNGLLGGLNGLGGFTPQPSPNHNLGGVTPSPNPPDNNTGGSDLQQAEAEINRLRANSGAPPLHLNDQLQQWSKQRSAETDQTGMIHHLGGGSWGECLASGGNLLSAVHMWESEGPGGPHYELLHNSGYSQMGLSMGDGGIVNLQLA